MKVMHRNRPKRYDFTQKDDIGSEAIQTAEGPVSLDQINSTRVPTRCNGTIMTANPPIIRNFHCRDFPSAEQLSVCKENAGLSISLVIPALNEARTIGPILSSVYASLVRATRLIDEIIVIDGLSDDATRAVAVAAGAKVLSFNEAGPFLECSGKGAALWKSQFVTQGEIILFLDADILNFGMHFVTGLIGPLLQNDDIYFVKAYYRRPLRIGTAEYENFGGRITELLVRPMLSAFVPELAAVYQPLGGEYAVRRSVLESLPFASGYGVEIGLLFDFYRRFGLEHLAQVDLERRVHRNRSVKELGLVAFGVLQVMMKKLEQQNMLSIKKELVSSLFSPNGGVLEETAIEDVELPPRRELAVPVSIV